MHDSSLFFEPTLKLKSWCFLLSFAYSVHFKTILTTHIIMVMDSYWKWKTQQSNSLFKIPSSWKALSNEQTKWFGKELADLILKSQRAFLILPCLCLQSTGFWGSEVIRKQNIPFWTGSISNPKLPSSTHKSAQAQIWNLTQSSWKQNWATLAGVASKLRLVFFEKFHPPLSYTVTSSSKDRSACYLQYALQVAMNIQLG